MNRVFFILAALLSTALITARTTDREAPKLSQTSERVPFFFEAVETEETTTKQTKAEYKPLYAVNGEALDVDLQRYAYEACVGYDIAWYFPTLLCQIYQESRFDENAKSSTGDYGLMQLNGKYLSYFAELAECSEEDLINDPRMNIRAGIALMAKNVEECASVDEAISTYNTGSRRRYNEKYVNAIRAWEETLEGVEYIEEKEFFIR